VLRVCLSRLAAASLKEQSEALGTVMGHVALELARS
jgi:hypothetical protein